MAKHDPQRERRLAEALRTNLRRRKARSRAPSDTADDSAPHEAATRDQT